MTGLVVPQFRRGLLPLYLKNGEGGQCRARRETLSGQEGLSMKASSSCAKLPNSVCWSGDADHNFRPRELLSAPGMPPTPQPILRRIVEPASAGVGAAVDRGRRPRAALMNWLSHIPGVPAVMAFLGISSCLPKKVCPQVS